MERESAIIYRDLYETIEECIEDEADKAEAYAAFCRYIFYGEEYTGTNKVIKATLRPYLKKAKKAEENYQKKVEVMNSNRKNRYQSDITNTNSDITKQNSDITNTNSDITSDSEYDSDSDSEYVSDSDNESFNTHSGVKTKKETRRVSKEEPNWFPTDEEMHDEFEAFLEVRKKLKAPNTVHAVTLLISRLNKLSADRDEQLAIIRQSTENGWKGLYPLKDDSKKARAAPEDDYLLSVINGGGG